MNFSPLRSAVIADHCSGLNLIIVTIFGLYYFNNTKETVVSDELIRVYETKTSLTGVDILANKDGRHGFGVGCDNEVT